MRYLLQWARRSSLPGFGGVPVYDVFIFVLLESRRDDIITRANSVAFSFFLAMFPSLIFLIAILPYFPIGDLSDIFEFYLNTVLPASAESFLHTTLEDLNRIPRGGILSVGVVLAFYFSSNGMLGLMRGFDKSHPTIFKKRSKMRKRLVAVVLTVLLGMLLLVSGILIVLGNILLGFFFDFFHLDDWSRLGFQALKWLAVVVLVYSVIACIYRYGPAVHRKLNFFSPGATLAAIASILTSAGFAFFVNNFGTYNKIYGSISAIIVLLIWIQFISLFILIGFELNVGIALSRNLRRQKL